MNIFACQKYNKAQQNLLCYEAFYSCERSSRFIKFGKASL